MGKSDSSEKADFYRWIAPVFDLAAGPFLGPARRRIVRIAKTAQCGRILDVACGTAEQAIMFSRAGFEAVGLDLSPSMLAVARSKTLSGASLLRGDARMLPFGPCTFDCVTISLALHEMDRATGAGAAGEMLRVLKPGGRLIVFDYGPARRFGAAFGLALMSVAERMAGARHFANFVRFARAGGVDRLPEALHMEPVSSGAYFFGALRIAVWKKKAAAAPAGTLTATGGASSKDRNVRETSL